MENTCAYRRSNMLSKFGSWKASACQNCTKVILQFSHLEKTKRKARRHITAYGLIGEINIIKVEGTENLTRRTPSCTYWTEPCRRRREKLGSLVFAIVFFSNTHPLTVFVIKHSLLNPVCPKQSLLTVFFLKTHSLGQ